MVSGGQNIALVFIFQKWLAYGIVQLIVFTGVIRYKVELLCDIFFTCFRGVQPYQEFLSGKLLLLGSLGVDCVKLGT